MLYTSGRNVLQARKKCSAGAQEMFYRRVRNVLEARKECSTYTFRTFLSIVQINVLCIGFALSALYIKGNMTDNVHIT
jgi:hypothetical protein